MDIFEVSNILKAASSASRSEILSFASNDMKRVSMYFSTGKKTEAFIFWQKEWLLFTS